MTKISPSLRIGVLRGGAVYPQRPVHQYEKSLESGAHILDILSETHRPIDIFVSKDGAWHMRGVVKPPEKILKNTDVVFNTIDGIHGEGVHPQEILRHLGIPFVGSGITTMAMAKHRQAAKEMVFAGNIKTPMYTLVDRGDDVAEKAKHIFNSIPQPILVKSPFSNGLNGAYNVDSLEDLHGAMNEVLSVNPRVLVEEYISGKIFSCLIVESFRGDDLYSFPPFSMDGHVGSAGALRKEVEILSEAAKNIHKILNFSHYSQSYFVVSPRRGVYFLETNSSPSFGEKSPIMQSIRSVGVSAKEFIHHLISLAMDTVGLV